MAESSKAAKQRTQNTRTAKDGHIGEADAEAIRLQLIQVSKSNRKAKPGAGDEEASKTALALRTKTPEADISDLVAKPKAFTHVIRPKPAAPLRSMMPPRSPSPSRARKQGWQLHVDSPAITQYTKPEAEMLVRVTSPYLDALKYQDLYTVASLMGESFEGSETSVTISQIRLDRFRRILETDNLLPGVNASLYRAMANMPIKEISMDRHLQDTLRVARSLRHEWADVVACLRKHCAHIISCQCTVG